MNHQNIAPVKLDRALSFWDAFSIVAGGVIGTGIFIKVATMTQAMGSFGYVMLAWIIAGLLSLSGALVYGELGTLYPQAGGEYVYLRESFGTFTAFLYGWQRTLIANPGSLAAYAVGAAIFLSSAVNLEGFAIGPVKGPNAVATFFILFFTIINCFKVSVGGRLQTVMTAIKVLLIVGLALVLFVSGKGDVSHFFQGSEDKIGWPGFGAFSAAMIAALWAYDGWNNLPMMAGEIKNPKRNVPLSLVIGMLTVLILYSLVNLAYFYVLPIPEILSSNSNAFPDALPAATKAVQVIMGAGAVKFMSVMFMISALGALNGSTMSFARVPFAMAKDGVFFKPLAKVHPTTHVPMISIIVQLIVSCIFAALLDFDKITNYVIFSSWIFYALVTSSIFKFRKMHGVPKEGYRTWGYPWMPIIFIVVSAFLLYNTVRDSMRDSLIGLGIIAAGIPLYWLFKKKNQTVI